MTFAEPLRLSSDEHCSAWGGARLTGTPSVGELWVAHGDSRVRTGPHAGATLSELCARAPLAMTGNPARRSFPLIVKLLDTAGWLSLQVHPDDACAVRYDGAEARGKTEAWHIIDADPGAEMVTGPKQGSTRGGLQSGLATGDPLGGFERQPIRRGDSVLIPARTIHSLSAGVLAYEVQQASNATFRVYDWDRDRELHPDRFWETADLEAQASIAAPGKNVTIEAGHFRMRVLQGSCDESPGRTFQVVTAVDSDVIASGEGWSSRVSPMDTILVPAALGAYALESEGRIIVSSPVVPAAQ